MSRRLITTADDFGMSIEVNEAVELSHREGILRNASLVVSGAAADDAIRRAKRMPDLGVGLHLALYGAPAESVGLPPSPIAPDGRNLGEAPVRTGTAIMLSPSVRAAARREIAAQFDAWRRSGLPLGHLDGHWHCHQHPAVLAMALEQGRPLGLRAVRVPHESFALSRRIGGGGTVRRLVEAVSHYPLALFMRRRIRAAGMRANDWFFGKNDEGRVDSDLLARLIAGLPEGSTEIGLHPAVRQWPGPHAPPRHWTPQDEVQALTDPEVREIARAQNVQICRWADLP